MKNSVVALAGLLVSLWVAFVWLALSPLAHAESGAPYTVQAINGSSYRIDAQTALFRTGAGSADRATIDATFYAAVPVFAVNGKQNIKVSGRFTNSAATCKIRFIGVYNPSALPPHAVFSAANNFFTDLSDEVTLTATSTIIDAAGKYVAPSRVLDTFGCAYGYIAVTGAVSAGTCDFADGSY